MNTAEKQFIREEEYAAGEELSEVKHEWFNGEVFAMAGGTPTHATLCFNVGAALRNALRGKECRGSGSEQRVKVEATGLLTYPDALVVCPPERFDERDPNSLLNPTVLFEVLSLSTENYDRTTKFEHFKQIESLSDYVLISADWVRVEHFARGEGKKWVLETFILRSQSVSLLSSGIELPLQELYERVELPEGLQPRPSERVSEL